MIFTQNRYNLGGEGERETDVYLLHVALLLRRRRPPPPPPPCRWLLLRVHYVVEILQRQGDCRQGQGPQSYALVVKSENTNLQHPDWLSINQ